LAAVLGRLVGDVAGDHQQAAAERSQGPAVRLQGDPVPVDVADPQAHRRPLPAPGEDLALGLGERLQVVGVDGLGAEGVPADAVGDRVAGDALHRRAHGADPALGVQDADDVGRGLHHRLEGRLPLAHGRLGLAALGDVHDVAEGVGQPAVVVVDEPGHAVEPAVAVPEQEPELLLELGRPLGHGPVEGVREPLAVPGVDLGHPEPG
jgi:hypothetical protein